MIDLNPCDPFPGAETIALEVTPAGPYATFRRPWDVGAIPAVPRSFGGLLAEPDRYPSGVRLTATVVRMSSYRWTFTAPLGLAYVRGFTRDGRMIWSGTYAKIEPFELVSVRGDGIVASFNLLGGLVLTEYT